ncbi:MAG: 30S ribosomal protein S12 methylthiotransferase RimO [Bacteroidales bacterium]|nr:30S ribosomal protein S12 methylthiotransferase RimO [Bacteroidales bacterium]
MRAKNNRKTINMVTLGCSKNIVDSEVLMKQLSENGLQVVHNSNEPSDAVIINTCGFIKDAKEESIDTILQFTKAKERGDIGELYVMGCLSERYKNDLQNEIPDVDKYFGANDMMQIIKHLGYNYKENLVGERLITTPKHYAYLKISEGCDRQCSFCAIPLMRGKHRSKPVENILREAKILVNNGVKELILIAQDLTYYGVDLNRKQLLASLLEQLSDISGLQWIRLHYAYPTGFPKDVLKVMLNHENICNYLDIPFQHISDPVLKNMRRGLNKQQTYNLIDLLRNEVPDLTLRTTLMVGHPGEGEKEFAELNDLVEKIRFDRLGVFTYCEEEDTFGARNFKDDIPEEIKNKRLEELINIQRSISYEINASKVGTNINVLIDRSEGEYYIGRSEADSPEVDNEVIVKSDMPLNIGNFYRIRITNAEEYDIYGSVC